MPDSAPGSTRSTTAGGIARAAGRRYAPRLGLALTGAAVSITAGTRGHVVVRGWLDPNRAPAPVTALTATVDGRLVREVPLAGLGAPWHEPVTGRSDWVFDVEAAPWSRVEVHVRAGQQRIGLGVLMAPAEHAVAAQTGPDDAALDLPRPDTDVSLAACLVSGWAILDGHAPDRVEVFVDSEPARPVRRGLPRADIPGDVGHTCGFESVVPLGDRRAGDSVTLMVRAIGVAGTVWHSEAVTVRFGPTPEPEPTTGPLIRAPRRATLTSARNRRPPDQPIKVVVFTHSLRLGGGQLHLQHMALRMAAAGEVDLTVVSPEDGVLRHELEQAGIAVHITRGYSVDPATYSGQLAEFAALICALDADVVMANTLGVFPAIDAARVAGVPSAWVIHESFELPVFEYLNWGPSGLPPAVHERFRATLREADAVVFETPSTLSMFADAVPGLNAVMVRYGVDATAIHEFIARTDRAELRAAAGYQPDDTVFVCMGVFEPRKAILALVEAFADAAQHLAEPQLVLVGDHPAPYCDAVARLIQARGLGGRIKAVGINSDIYPWYHLADFMISASDIESLPRSMLEAMTFGRPIVSTDTFGTGELVEDGDNGFLCTPNSHTALVAAISRAARLDPADRARMGQRSAQRVIELGGFDYDREYTQLLRNLATRNPRLGGHCA